MVFGKRWIGWTIAAAAGIAAAVAGCEVGPEYHAPTIAVSQHFNLAQTRPTTEPIRPDLAAIPTPRQLQRWWETFHDPELNHLIERALQTNLSLQSAVQNIRQARAQEGISYSGFFPMINGTSQYSHSRRSGHLGSGSAVSTPGGSGAGGTVAPVTGGGNLEGDFYQVGFDSTWEIDVFGGIRRGVESAEANVQVQIENRRSVLITLLGDVATDYVQLRGLQLQVQIVTENINTQQQTLELIRTQNRAGLVAVQQQQAQVLTTEAELPDLEAQIHQTIHQLSILLGAEPSLLESELQPVGPIPLGPTYVPPGLPSDLLRRRPDVRLAEYQVAAASAQIGVATADLFPKFTLTGSLGFESSQFHQLLNLNSRYFSFGPSVNWPIFEAGSIRYNIEVQNALEREAFYNYEATVLTSFQEVEDSLIIYAKEQDRRAELAQAVVADQKAVELTQALYKNGLDTFLDVLTTQQTLLVAQQSLVLSEQSVSTDLVALYKALGGGWESMPN
jgi:outer membrane protein, multidrug efflux system